jgi:hypothetical protein
MVISASKAIPMVTMSMKIPLMPVNFVYGCSGKLVVKLVMALFPL